MLHVNVVIRGVSSADEDHLEQLTTNLESFGALDPAVVYYPQDAEIAIVFDVEEAALGRLLESNGDRAAA